MEGHFGGGDMGRRELLGDQCLMGPVDEGLLTQQRLRRILEVSGQFWTLLQLFWEAPWQSQIGQEILGGQVALGPEGGHLVFPQCLSIPGD